MLVGPLDFKLKPILKFLFVAILFNLLLSTHSFANTPINIHVTTGMLDVSYTGVRSGKLSFGNIYDVGGEVMTGVNRSFIFHGTIGLDPTTSVTNYMYAGLGTRYYIASNPREIYFTNGNDKIQYTPHRQYFITPEAGIAEINVFSLGPALFTMASILEFGISFGTNWLVYQNVGVLAQVGVSEGFGFSSVNLNDTAIKIFVGISFL